MRHRVCLCIEKCIDGSAGMTDKELHKLKRHELVQLLLMEAKEAQESKEIAEGLKEQAEQSAQQVERLKKKLDQKDEQLERLKIKLNEKDKQIEHLKERLNEKDEKIALLRNENGTGKN